jgi:L-fucose isomerase-like protein
MCCLDHGLRRRDFVALTGVGAVTLPELAPSELWDPERPFEKRYKSLRVRPVLLYATPAPKPRNSWKSWGGVLSEAAAAEELGRIAGEWEALRQRADFPIEVLPCEKASSVEAAAALPRTGEDVRVIYPAAGSGAMLRAAIGEKGETLIFARHRSGPVYYWYEALSTRYLRKSNVPLGTEGAPRVSVNDVVVDDQQELMWRLRALCGLKTFRGTKILALGGPWGKYAPEAPQVAREKFGLEIINAGYDDFEKRISSALKDGARIAQAQAWTERYLKMPGTRLETERGFVVNAFVLYAALKQLMKEHGAEAFTIQSCMGTVLPMARTTACLTLGLMCDEGIPAFCESDFVVIPACLLLRAVSGRPVFMHNSTFPHNGVVTCAHCAAPRRMDGSRYEPVRVLTHYESEYGAAPKVEIPVGQEVTFVDPEYATCRWVGMKGVVEANPFMPICRSQQDVRISGDWRRLLDEVRDSHWAMAYGDWLKECGYAAARTGVSWDSIA